jgi:hypothetical protein
MFRCQLDLECGSEKFIRIHNTAHTLHKERGDFLYTSSRNSKRCFLGLVNIGYRMLNPEFIPEIF